jgi:alpha 1,6-mannosyltransferase
VKTLQSLKDAGKGGKKVYEETERINVLDEPNMGGPVGVMDWTGPGLFTDAVLG